MAETESKVASDSQSKAARDTAIVSIIKNFQGLGQSRFGKNIITVGSGALLALFEREDVPCPLRNRRTRSVQSYLHYFLTRRLLVYDGCRLFANWADEFDTWAGRGSSGGHASMRGLLENISFMRHWFEQMRCLIEQGDPCLKWYDYR